MLVTPFQIAVPISPPFDALCSILSGVNKPDSHAPALSIRLHTPSWMDVPSAFQSMVCTAESPALNRLDSHSPRSVQYAGHAIPDRCAQCGPVVPEITAAALSQLCVRPSPSNREPKNVPTASVTVESASPTVVNAPLMEPITPSTFSVASSPKAAVSPAEKASRSEAPFLQCRTESRYSVSHAGHDSLQRLAVRVGKSRRGAESKHKRVNPKAP